MCKKNILKSLFGKRSKAIKAKDILETRLDKGNFITEKPKSRGVQYKIVMGVMRHQIRGIIRGNNNEPTPEPFASLEKGLTEGFNNQYKYYAAAAITLDDILEIAREEWGQYSKVK